MTPTIKPRKCPVCGSQTYRSGTLQAHYAAVHPAQARRMVPVR